jgi:hypothetical protein
VTFFRTTQTYTRVKLIKEAINEQTNCIVEFTSLRAIERYVKQLCNDGMLRLLILTPHPDEMAR